MFFHVLSSLPALFLPGKFSGKPILPVTGTKVRSGINLFTKCW